MNTKQYFVILTIGFLILALSLPVMASPAPVPQAAPNFQSTYWWESLGSSVAHKFRACDDYSNLPSYGRTILVNPNTDIVAVAFRRTRQVVQHAAEYNNAWSGMKEHFIGGNWTWEFNWQGSNGESADWAGHYTNRYNDSVITLIKAAISARGYDQSRFGAVTWQGIEGGIDYIPNAMSNPCGEVNEMVEVDVLHFSVQPTATASPSPTPFCDQTVATWRNTNLLSTGTVVAGSLLANKALIDGQTNYVIDFTLTGTTPARLDGYNGANLSVGIDDPNGLRDPAQPSRFTVTVNGNVFSGDPFGGPLSVSLAGGSAFTLVYHAQIPGRAAGANETMTVAMVGVRTAAYLDAGTNLLCDPGMEQWPGSDSWEAAGEGDWGRLNATQNDAVENAMNGLAYCSVGMQAAGAFYSNNGGSTDKGQPIKQRFHWDGGTAQWKFRAAAGHLGAFGKVSIVDTAGSEISVLFNGPLIGFLLIPVWDLHTGEVDLDDGDYDIVLAMQGVPDLQTVYYDDIAIGSEIDTDCQEDLYQIPNANSPTPTATGITPTPTTTLAITNLPTQATVTSTTAPIVPGTSTARPTRTATIIASPTLGDLPPATKTPTPYGTPGDSNGPRTSTPDPNSTPWGTPTNTSWQGGDLPPGGEGMSPGTGVCTEPNNPWSISWWVDYEFCRLFYSVSWQPGHTATLVAAPSMFADREPMNSIQEVQSGVNAISTEIASEVAANPGFVKSGAPDQTMFKAAPASPWNGAPLRFGPLGQNQNTFSTYCSHKMITTLGTYMAPGFCFALNILRDLGVLLWFQFLIDILCLWGMVKTAMVTIRFYPLLTPSGGSAEGK